MFYLFVLTLWYLVRSLDYKLDAIVGLDSRGYYFGVVLADALGLPFVAVRKAGKLPGACKKISYALEYGTAEMEIQEEALKAGARVVVVDDLMATGGTAAAACNLISQVGAVVVEVHVMVELDGLKGRDKLPQGVPLYSLTSKPCDVE